MTTTRITTTTTTPTTTTTTATTTMASTTVGWVGLALARCLVVRQVVGSIPQIAS